MKSDSVIRVALLGATPPNSGGIASWTQRMLTTDCYNQCELLLVDERLEDSSTIFSGRRSITSEVRRSFRIWRDLAHSIKAYEINVVHSNTPASTTSLIREVVCALIAKIHHCAFVGHFLCTVPVVVKSNLNIFALRFYLALCDVTIVLNKQSKEFIQRFSNKPICLIPNFIKKSELTSGDKVRFYAGPVRRVVYAGGITEEKGILEVLSVAEKCPEIEFRLAGAGELAPEIDIPGNVKFLGSLNRSDLMDEYDAADAFIFLTHFPAEGFSCSLLEAMASGLPCVVTDWAANKEMIGTGGFVVPVGDIDGAVASLKNLADSDLRARMGAGNFHRAQRDYSEQKVVAEYERVYHMARQRC